MSKVMNTKPTLSITYKESFSRVPNNIDVNPFFNMTGPDRLKSKNANPAYKEFERNFGSALKLDCLCDKYVQKKKDDWTKANLNFLAEHSGERIQRGVGNYNRPYYRNDLNVLSNRLNNA